jgi:hypothetical protein
MPLQYTLTLGLDDEADEHQVAADAEDQLRRAVNAAEIDGVADISGQWGRPAAPSGTKTTPVFTVVGTSVHHPDGFVRRVRADTAEVARRAVDTGDETILAVFEGDLDNRA